MKKVPTKEELEKIVLENERQLREAKFDEKKVKALINTAIVAVRLKA